MTSSAVPSKVTVAEGEDLLRPSDRVVKVSKSKVAVREFWDERSCGEVYTEGSTEDEQLQTQASARYRLEPYLRPFARFDGADKDVIEIGVGMGADHAEWAKSRPRHLVGIDFSRRAIQWTEQRLSAADLNSGLAVGDVENLPFRDSSFDVVYSWGVLHHTPDTQRAFDEAHRVLRPGGDLRVMIYHRPSVVGLMLWIRYGFLRMRPWISQTDLYSSYLESPGTQGFTVAEAKELVSRFDSIEVETVVSLGDLLEGEVGQRHRGLALQAAKMIWPRSALRRLPGLGLFMLIKARKFS